MAGCHALSPWLRNNVIQRCNNRSLFYSEADYKAYLIFSQDAASKYQVVPMHSYDD